MFNPNIENSYPCAFCSHKGVCRFKDQFSEFYAKYAKEDNDASDKPECATIIINCKYKQQDTYSTIRNINTTHVFDTGSMPMANPCIATASSACDAITNADAKIK